MWYFTREVVCDVSVAREDHIDQNAVERQHLQIGLASKVIARHILPCGKLILRENIIL